MDPYLERVKKHLGTGFEEWSKKSGSQPEKRAYRYVERHNIQHINYERLKESQQTLKDQIQTGEEHLQQLGTTDGDPDRDEWAKQIADWKTELAGIKLDPQYAKGI